MKRDGKMLICLTGGLVLSASAQALTADAPGNPYQGVVERNVFAIKPPPDPSSLKPAEPEPPKITPQGIMSMFGRQQVLFKTVMPGTKPGEPPKETAMVLSVGQREGEIEVVAVDESTGTITFNNHGKLQTLSLEKDGQKPPTGPAVAPLPRISVPGNPGVPAPAAAFNPVPSGAAAGSALRNIPIPTRSLRLPTMTGVGGSSPMIAGAAPIPGTAAATPTLQIPQPKPLSPEEQAAIMIIQKEQNPDGPPMPPIPGIHE